MVKRKGQNVGNFIDISEPFVQVLHAPTVYKQE
jgi:hypothetical protein